MESNLEQEPAAAEAGDAREPGLAVGPLTLGIFLGSAAVLHLQILQTRIFSVLLWHHLTYLVVTFTMLGFAAGGTLLALFPGLLRAHPPRFLASTGILFALSTVATYAFLGRSEVDTLQLLKHRAQYLYVFVYYLYLVVPYVFGGLLVVGALKVAGPRTGLIYGANLAGSAAGCLSFALTLTVLGGQRSLLLAAALAALAAAAFAWSRRPRTGAPPLGVAALLLAVVLGGSFAFAERLLPLHAARSKPMVELMEQARERGREPRIETSRWDPLCRLDVVDFGDGETRRVFQDADAPTEIFPAAQPFDYHSIYCLPYRVAKPQPDVLVIGVGGGQDLRQAVWNRARSVTGVEINRSTAALMEDEYREFAGDPYHLPGVEVKVTEGRSFVRRTDARYDLIQMTGTDTYAALSSGSYVLSESYLYTLEAFDDFFSRLNPGGVVSVLRFRFFPPRESLRLVAIAVEALRRRGAEHPERHVIVVDKIHEVQIPGDPGRTEKFAYSAMLFKESPFNEEEIAAASAYVEQHPANQAPGGALRHILAYAPGEPADNEFGRYLAAVAEGTEREQWADYPYRIDPVSDDSPFFFKYHRWSSLFGETRAADYFGVIGRDPIGLFLLLTALLESLVLVALLVILPLLVSRRLRMPRECRGSVLLYFLGIGVGFLFLEISAMQRLVLYLGHPTRSITVVLFSFLLFSGLGSLVAGRLVPRRAARGALRAIVVLVVLYAFFLPRVLDATLAFSTGTRVLLAVLLLGVPSFFMGMPFPSALCRLTGRFESFLPWAFAINGGASVIASVVSILVAMSANFTWVFALAAGFYGLALLVEKHLPDSPPTAP